MDKWRKALRAPGLEGALWVALCFGLTSAAYLSWLDRLVALAGGATADWLSMGAGYAAQAAGMGLVCLWLRRNPEWSHRPVFAAAALLFGAMTAPALLADSAAGVAGFGLAVNLLCGGIAGFYLCDIAQGRGPVGRVFGGGYAIATVAVGLLALIRGGGLLHSRYALLLYLPLSAAMAVIAMRRAAPEPSEAAPAGDAPPVALACAVVAAISLVKNLGFCFPSADIQAGLSPELSRLPYAAGLVAAGFIHDKNRKGGMLCAGAALILPFVMLGLTREPVPAAICWGLDYLFFAFFSVFRAALFLEFARGARRWALAPLGLLAGRLGDAAGTAVGMLLAGHRVALIGVTALAFFPTAFLFYRLYQKLYEPQVIRQRSAQEVFEAFCLHNDLSPREREVLRMVLDNRSNGEIAELLFITESTVKYHVRNVLQKAGCKNRGELQRKYTLMLYPDLDTGGAAATAEGGIL